MIGLPSRLELRTFPSDDDAFRRFAEDELARLDSLDPEHLQRLVRVRYPMAVVRVRSRLASFAGDPMVWYALRRAVIDPPEDRWWEHAASWAIIAADRTFIEASEPFAAILELPLTTLIGQRIDDLANPADPTAAEDVAALWLDLVQRGEAHGTLRFNRLDETPREIEYHIGRDGVGAGRYRALIREP